MTNKDCIAELKEARNIMDSFGTVCMSIETIDKCIEALEKQKPKKAVITEENFGGIKYKFCPICGHCLGLKPHTNNYCSECGQAIDWSDYNED